jgi:hypothetical protein
MINQNPKRFICILEFWSPFFQAFNNCQQFFIINLVVVFGSRIFSRKISHGLKGSFIIKL